LICRTKVAPRLTELEPLVWPQDVEIGPFEKVAVLPDQPQVAHRQVGGQWDIDDQLGHIGVDIHLFLLTCNRDSMVPITHKVDIADLIEINGWEINPLRHCLRDVAPTVLQVRCTWQEAAIKIAIPPFTAHDLLDRHDPEAEAALATDSQAGPDISQRGHGARSTANDVQERGEVRRTAGTVKLALR